MLIKNVRWDSGFFGKKIGRIALADLDPLIFEKEKDKFDLIYIEQVLKAGAHARHEFKEASFTDHKIAYAKHVEALPGLPAGISIFKSDRPGKPLTALALQSGEYSRFRRDPDFSEKSYSDLYTEWIRNSVNHKLAFCILIHGDPKDPDGFITLRKCGDTAHVGLFAVSKSARNRGIGKKLMQAAEFIAGKHHFPYISVTTQADNKLACRLYERCGFRTESVIYTYHWWNK